MNITLSTNSENSRVKHKLVSSVLIVSLFPATSQPLSTTEVGCHAREHSSYIRSDHISQLPSCVQLDIFRFMSLSL